jgi:hypothetical protein
MYSRKSYRFFKDMPVVPSYPMPISSQLGFPPQLGITAQPVMSSIQFYDPITGALGPKVDASNTNPFVNNDVFSKTSYTKDDITGSDRNVEAIRRLLEIASVNPALSASSVDSMTAPIKEHYAINKPLPTLSAQSIVPNPRAPGKMVLTTNIPGVLYSGSGILLIEASKRPDGSYNLTTLLFRSSTTGTYEELGGEIDSKLHLSEQTLQENAKKEASEESVMLFDFSGINLERSAMGVNLFIDVKDSNGMNYRCYLVCLNQTYSSLESAFLVNKRNISAFTTDSAFAETDSINRFYLRNLRDCLRVSPTEDSLTCNDWIGNSVAIRGRTKKILKELMMTPTLLTALVANQSNTNVVKQGSIGAVTTIFVS